MQEYIEDASEPIKQLMLQQYKNMLEGAHRNNWLGVYIQKHPCDLQAYQEILFETKPDVIIEIGSCQGGSTYFFASMCDLIGHGRVISIEVNNQWADQNPKLRNHKRITWIWGDAFDQQIVQKVKNQIGNDERVFVIEDSAHEYTCTKNALDFYHSLVKSGDYFIVEDTILPHDNCKKAQTYLAVEDFLREHPEWEVDRAREKMITTWAPHGFLRRK